MTVVITDKLTIDNEMVLSERVTTSEFRIREIHESIANRFVRVEIEFGPFVSETRPNGTEEVRGSRHHAMNVWENESYDAIRDTWRNEDLVQEVLTRLNAG